MADFDVAVAYVLENEGGLNEGDKGGVTNFGISLRFLRELSVEQLRKYGIFEGVNEEVMRGLTLDQAKCIYRDFFWEASFNEIYDQSLANYIFDMVVNMGAGSAIKMVQRAVWAIYGQDYIKDDGVFGVETLKVVNDIGYTFLVILVACRDIFYRCKDQKDFLNGWLNRTYKINRIR